MKVGDLVKLRHPVHGAGKLSGILLKVNKPRNKKEKCMGITWVDVLWNDGRIMEANGLRLEVISEIR